MKGRKPRPTNQQLAAGDPSKIGVHKLEERLAREAAAREGLPDCPGHLKGRARKAWAFWVEELAYMDLDKRPDAMALEGACNAYARAVEADLEVARDGMTFRKEKTLKNGERVLVSIRNHPALMTSFRAWHQVRMFCAEFGFTPVSRTRLAMEKAATSKGTDTDLATLLKSPRKREGAEKVN